MTTLGSHFVFADRIYIAKEETERSTYQFDAGHPLRVDYSVIRSFLDTHFDPLWDNETKGNAYDKDIYYIGKRKAPKTEC